MKLSNKEVAAAKPQVAESKIVGYRLEQTPKGKALFTYWLAVMKNAGGFTSGRKVMDRDALVRYFATSSVITNHTANGNLEKTANGIRLTTTGWNYFNGRLTGSTVGQEVDKAEMEALAKALKTGKLEAKTKRFPLTTKFVALTK